MNNYECFYRGKRMSVQAASSYQAQQLAAKAFKARKEWEVSVVLADKPVNTASIG